MDHNGIDERNLLSRLPDLLTQYRRLLSSFPQGVPQAVVFEFQHALAHLSYYLRHTSKAPRIKHLNSVSGHLERGIIDAYKHIVFEPAKFTDWASSSTDCMRAVMAARIKEFHDVDKTQASEMRLRADDYRGLCEHFGICSFPEPQKDDVVSFPLRGNARKEDFFKFFTEWAQLELVYSALHGKKNANFAENAIAAFFNDRDSIQLRNCIEIIKIEIIHETLWSETHRDSFLQHSSLDPSLLRQAFSALRAYNATLTAGNDTSPHHATILPLYPSVQTFWGYELKPFIDINTPATGK